MASLNYLKYCILMTFYRVFIKIPRKKLVIGGFMATDVLYRAQRAGHESVRSRFFPEVSQEYVGSQTGIKGKALHGYLLAQRAVTWIRETAAPATSFISSGVRAGGDFIGEKVRPVADFAFPLNPINGRRHFVGIPRKVEKFLGEYLFYPLSTRSLGGRTFEALRGEGIADKVEGVLGRLRDANQSFLNPEGETPFEYRVLTVASQQVNAFATPGGGMVVFSQIVKEIDGAVQSELGSTTVTLADGSEVEVDLSRVTTEDILAALMGHEMTHAASRHSMTSLTIQLIQSVVFKLGRMGLIIYLKSQDKEYQRLSRDNRNSEEFLRKEARYDTINTFLAKLEERLIHPLSKLFHSRKHEYEADITGTFFAHQAGYNPLGALALQQILLDKSGKGIGDSLHKHLEILYTHPYGENRKRAIYAAIKEISPQLFQKAEGAAASA